ncbi:MAG: hypothetical protein GWP15_03375 [Nitrospirae bacterium]|nr:hypothetical protein [Nitrospirota bacterium]
MKNYKKNTSGLILIDALMAMGILVVGVVIIGGLINGGVRIMTYSKNNLIAQNLATEVVEAVKNVYNSNLLLHADDPGCWLELDPDEDIGCIFKVEIGDHYVPEEAAGGGWKLTEVLGVLDLSDSISDEGFRLDADSIFYREINVMNLVDSEPDGVDDYAEFEVVVEWMEGRVIRSIRRIFTLFNDIQ